MAVQTRRLPLSRGLRLQRRNAHSWAHNPQWIRGSGGPPRGGTPVDVGMVVWLFDREVATYSLCQIWLLNKIRFRWFGSLASLCIVTQSLSRNRRCVIYM